MIVIQRQYYATNKDTGEKILVVLCKQPLKPTLFY